MKKRKWINPESKRIKSLKICASLYWEFFKIGIFTIGGGTAMIPQLQHVVVEEKKWLDEEDMLNGIAVSQAVPGVIAVNGATYIGMRLNGIKGALAATLGVITPSFAIIILVVSFLNQIGENSYVQGMFTGIKAAVCALIIATVVKLGKKSLKFWLQWLLAAVAIIAIGVFGINAIWMIILGAVVGVIYYSVKVGRKSEDAEVKK